MTMSRTLMSALLIGLLAARAQAATLAGVAEEQGQPVAEAEILLVNADSSQILKSIYSAADGSFRFGVAPGSYHIGAQKTGYTLVWQRGIAVGKDDVMLRIEMIDKAFADGPPKAAGGDCE